MTSKRRKIGGSGMTASRLLALEAIVLAIGALALFVMGAHLDPNVLALGLNFSPS